MILIKGDPYGCRYMKSAAFIMKDDHFAANDRGERVDQ